MTNPRLPSLLRPRRLSHWLLVALLPCLLQAGGTETQDVVLNEAYVFTQKPGDLAAKFTLGSPDIQIPEDISERLGGRAVSRQIKPTFENLLAKTNRFSVLINGRGRYTMSVAVTDLSVSQGKEAANKSVKVVEGLKNIFKASNPELEKMGLTLDTKNESVKTIVNCTVSVQLVDETQGGLLIDSETAEVVNTTTVKDMRMAIAGVNLLSSDPITSVVSQYNTRVVERAFSVALDKLLPRVDAMLAAGPAAPLPPTVAATPTAPPAAGETAPPATIARAAFCSQCGTKLAAEGKFCAGCGSRLAP